jgi:cytochrome P450
MHHIPSHVPTDLVRDFDFMSLQGDTDIYSHFKTLHAGPDIVYSPYYGGHWIFTRFDDMAWVLNNPEDFSNRHQTVSKNPVTVTLLENDGQIHKDFRQILQPFFTPKKISNLEQVATELTIELIEGFRARGEVEFTSEFALKMPITIIMNLCELPHEDTPQLLEIAEGLVRSSDPLVQQAAFAGVFQYFGSKILPARKARPGNDMISAIIHGKVEHDKFPGGRHPTDEEVLGLCCLLVAGGLDTVASMLGFITLYLGNHPHQRQLLLDDPALIPKAMEEMFRRHHIANVGRIAVRDINYKGVAIKAGDFILTPTSLAGLDERRYPDAMRVDFARTDNKHLVFGRGPHQCIGSFLARTEIRVFLREWLQRIPHWTLKAGEQPLMIPGKANRIAYLPLTWETT